MGTKGVWCLQLWAGKEAARLSFLAGIISEMGDVFLGGVPGKWLVTPLGAAGSGDGVGQCGRALLGQRTSR